MEFFAEVHGPLIEVQDLSDRLTISTLPAYCASIDTVLSAQSDSEGEIYCVWGQFKVSRQRIRNGVRFSLLNCPHALTWSVTLHERPQDIVIHCTIDKKEEDNEFVESIEQFVLDWRKGLFEQLRLTP